MSHTKRYALGLVAWKKNRFLYIRVFKTSMASLNPGVDLNNIWRQCQLWALRFSKNTILFHMKFIVKLHVKLTKPLAGGCRSNQSSAWNYNRREAWQNQFKIGAGSLEKMSFKADANCARIHTCIARMHILRTVVDQSSLLCALRVQVSLKTLSNKQNFIYTMCLYIHLFTITPISMAAVVALNLS